MITQAVYIRRQGDKEAISDYLAKLEKLTPDELIEQYTESSRKGLFGAHQQLLFFLAMRIAFLRLFETSPIRIKENYIVSLQMPPFSIRLIQ